MSSYNALINASPASTRCAGPGQLKFVAAVADANTHAPLDELEVLIERATQRSEAAGVVGFERHAGRQRDYAIGMVRQSAMCDSAYGRRSIYRRGVACQMKFQRSPRAPRSVFVIASLMTTSTNSPSIWAVAAGEIDDAVVFGASLHLTSDHFFAGPVTSTRCVVPTIARLYRIALFAHQRLQRRAAARA